MTGVDGVFHVAGWYKVGISDRAAAVGINIDGTRNVLELMRELRIPKGVYTSTLAVNSDTHGQVVDESYRFTGTARLPCMTGARPKPTRSPTNSSPRACRSSSCSRV